MMVRRCRRVLQVFVRTEEDVAEIRFYLHSRPGVDLLCLHLPSPPLPSSGQVPQDDWSGFSPLGKDDEIPCRRMRSGSYIKAMAEEDSGDSDCSPKPSPKVQARRASYLKATQPSLTEMTTLK